MSTKLKALTVGDKSLSYANWAKITKLNPELIRSRKRRGWTPEQCVGFAPPPPIPKRKPGPTGPHRRPNNLKEFEAIELKKIIVEQIDHLTIGAEVAIVRTIAGKTLQAAADACGWSEKHQWHLENGSMKWTAKSLETFNNVARGWVNGSDDNNAASSERVESV